LPARRYYRHARGCGRANRRNACKSTGPITEEGKLCFLRLANLSSYPLDRLSRYEAILWRQAGQILFALDALDRRKPQERRRRFRIDSRLAADGRDNY